MNHTAYTLYVNDRECFAFLLQGNADASAMHARRAYDLSRQCDKNVGLSERADALADLCLASGKNALFILFVEMCM